MNYDRVATAVAAAHETYVADLRSLMMGLRLAGKLTPEGLVSLQRDAARAMQDFLSAASAVAHDHLEDVFAGALTTRENAHKRAPFMGELRGIASAENAQLQAKIRGAGMGGLIGEKNTPMAALAKRADEKFEPTAADSAGRTWKADKLVRFLARDFAYQSHIDAQIARLVAAGQDLAQIVWMDPTHQDNGKVVALPLADELRTEFFHPNGNAQLAHVSA